MKPDASTPDRRTALMLAALSEQSGVAQALIDAKANVSARDADGWTPLMLASARGPAATVKLLLLAGAITEARNGAPVKTP